MFWRRETYSNKKILWFNPLQSFGMYSARSFLVFLQLYLNYAFWLNASLFLLSSSSHNFHEGRSPGEEWIHMANKVNHICATLSIPPPAHSNLSRIRLRMTFQCIYHGKKRNDFQSPMIASNMIHVKRLFQTTLNIVQNHYNFAYLDILLCWLPQREFSNLDVDKFCALFWIRKWTTEELVIIIVISFSPVFH